MKIPSIQNHRRRAAAGILAIAAVGLAGCGLQPAAAYVPEAGPGSLQVIDGAESTKVTVTSKQFTEQQIMGKIAVLTAKASGFEVGDLSNVPGSQPARELIATGRADVMFDYTGTAWLTYLKHETGYPDQKKQWQVVHDQDLDNGITWGAPAPLDNTYAFAIKASSQDKLKGITKLSQIADLPVKDRTFCVESEFNSRQDGFTPMLAKYGLKQGAADGVPTSNVSVLDTGAVYEATAQGACNFGEVFTTDGRIKSLNLTVLEDDKKFFPSYNVAPLFRTELVQKYPQLEANFAEVAKKMNNETFIELNRKVDVDGEEPADVAFDWMVKQGFISAK
ncbi:glycine betaine ABC transporter substrate-binding protein [Galactobacter caseinivorans]|uniref:Glycine/betaine ABC transporter substrate-binding protein n=1 Tax=Galactobacter caseinivorans TaxID=2676123 RepID=A0A496PIG3_9MICC|nr:glycine betaine ABC transporter substrate-binding protein [Galactobacter caseinivorans]RKW70271.1 glycine/betaine ABC transporter substrate-binding protein [Galactobacter caseinivorans]